MCDPKFRSAAGRPGRAAPLRMPSEMAIPGPLLLTGATGFIGRWLTARLRRAGVAVAALVLPDEVDRLPEGVRPVVGDVTQRETVMAAVARIRPAAVMHLAAVGMARPALTPTEAVQVNVLGTVHVLEALREVGGVQRVVLVGSAYEYGRRRSDDGLDPFNVYSASKVAAWAFGRVAFNAWGMPVVWVRPFQVYGPGQHARAFVPSAIRAALAGEDFSMTPGEQRRDFVYVEDVVEGMVAAVTAPGVEGRALDLGTGQLYRLLDVVEYIWTLTRARGRILAGALAYRPGEVEALAANVERTRRLMGWVARVGLEEGLRRTVRAFRAASA